MNTHIPMANANILSYDRIINKPMWRPNKQSKCDVQEKEKSSVYANC